MTRDFRDGMYEDEWWIELMEGELEPSFKKDLLILLKNSKGDREKLGKLETTRALIKSSDDAILPEDGRYYDRLHEKIMTAVVTAELNLESASESLRANLGLDVGGRLGTDSNNSIVSRASKD